MVFSLYKDMARGGSLHTNLHSFKKKKQYVKNSSAQFIEETVSGAQCRVILGRVRPGFYMEGEYRG